MLTLVAHSQLWVLTQILGRRAMGSGGRQIHCRAMGWGKLLESLHFGQFGQLAMGSGP